MYRALDVAKYVIERCNKMGYPISNLKLQKILYFIQAEFLVAFDEQCFQEDIEAWNFGPVVPEVYREYKIYGSASIPYLKEYDGVFINEEHKAVMDEVIDLCAQYTASTLVSITHNQKPWKDSFQRGRNCIISPKAIKEFFSEG